MKAVVNLIFCFVLLRKFVFIPLLFVCILRKMASALIIWAFDKLFCSSVYCWTDVELVNYPRLSLFPPQSNRCLCHRWILSHRCWSVRPPSIRLWSCGYETWRNTTMRCGERSACCPGSRPIAAIIATVAKATTCTPIPLKRVQVIARLKKELPRATARTVCLSLWWTNVRLVFWINTLNRFRHYQVPDLDPVLKIICFVEERSGVLLLNLLIRLTGLFWMAKQVNKSLRVTLKEGWMETWLKLACDVKFVSENGQKDPFSNCIESP